MVQNQQIRQTYNNEILRWQYWTKREEKLENVTYFGEARRRLKSGGVIQNCDRPQVKSTWRASGDHTHTADTPSKRELTKSIVMHTQVVINSIHMLAKLYISDMFSKKGVGLKISKHFWCCGWLLYIIERMCKIALWEGDSALQINKCVMVVFRRDVLIFVLEYYDEGQ